MCGIFGLGFQNGCDMTSPTITRNFIQNLFDEAEMRGTDASGIAFTNNTEIAVLKSPQTASKFITTKEFHSACSKYLTNDAHGAISIIAHCRQKTKGTERDNNNNHPIVCSNVVGVHNGIINNDEDLFSRFIEFEGFDRAGLVDSEVIFRLIDYFTHKTKIDTLEAITKMSRVVKGSYACAMVDRYNPFLLWLFRRTDPISIFHYEECGLVVFASLSVFIKNALQEVGFDDILGEPTSISLAEDHGICINLFSNEMRRFELCRERYQVA